MNGTPRLRSAFPSTPQSAGRRNGTPGSASKQSSSLPDVNALRNQQQETDGPLIPFDTIDAPHQRLYVVAFYVALSAWRLYDFHYLQEEETESLWLFMKWVAFDGVFLFGLPELRIPWSEWSTATMTMIFIAHAIVDGILMFRIPIPFGAGLVAVSKLFYDRELAISERHVKHSSIMHNASLILGKQVIHISPEGSAILNPGGESYCSDTSRTQVSLPIQINQTTPIGIDSLRFDIDDMYNETIHISASQIKKLTKEATKAAPYHSPEQPLTLHYPVKKTGMYVSNKVIDESKLEVQRRRVSDTIIIPCPQAIVKPANSDRCKGDLSNVELVVTGTPPLKSKYRKMINHQEQEASFQSIQPDDFASPLSQGSDALTSRGQKDISWARPQTVHVPSSESLGISGRWVYSMEEVTDAFGNTVSYSQRDHDDQEKTMARAPHLHQVINVHERPTVLLNGCNSQHPLKVAKGMSTNFPVQYSSTGKGGFLDTPYESEYLFTPENESRSSGDHSDSVQRKHVTIKNMQQKPAIQQAGLYSLHSVSTEFCSGEVLEPASCLLQNPPEPSLRIEKEEIFDKCANKAIGLRVDLHSTGTPPFRVDYHIMRKGERHASRHHVDINGLRGQIELTPAKAGHYTYDFVEVHDAIYSGFQSHGGDSSIEQDVKPSASAHFVDSSPRRQVCIDQPVSFDVRLRGEGPFSVEYELIRGNDREQYQVVDITDEQFTITTKALTKGGDYTSALASVTDRIGCKEFLKEEAKINVRHQKPKASFGQIEGGRSVKTLEGKKVQLPLRSTGEAPWTSQFRNSRNPDQLHQMRIGQANDRITVQDEATYELVQVQDAICPGSVDETANKFDSKWISRPSLQVAEGSFAEQSGSRYIKHEICEGEEDSIDLHFTGSPPFEVKYEETIKPEKGGKGPLRSKALNAALGVSSVRMDTSQAGSVEYKFSELGDYNYDHDSKHFTPVTIQQQVNSRPTARFTNPGKTYSYCSVESAGEEVIPITLTGQPPFNIEVEIKHHGTARPELINIPNVPSTTHNLRIPHSQLHSGTSAVSIRKVSDARGCSRLLDSASPRVQISVHDAPSISPSEQKEDFCVGDRISFALSGQAPFNVFYDFNGVSRKASASSTPFRRSAEKPGLFAITGSTDSGSNCRAQFNITRAIHGMPSVRVSKGKESYVDIHEGSEAEISFDFGGTPPFEFTWTRSTNARKGQKSQVLEMRSEVSYEHSMSIRASEEGTYEVVAIKDRYCAYAKEGVDLRNKKSLTY